MKLFFVGAKKDFRDEIILKENWFLFRLYSEVNISEIKKLV